LDKPRNFVLADPLPKRLVQAVQGPSKQLHIPHHACTHAHPEINKKQWVEKSIHYEPIYAITGKKPLAFIPIPNVETSRVLPSRIKQKTRTRSSIGRTRQLRRFFNRLLRCPSQKISHRTRVFATQVR